MRTGSLAHSIFCEWLCEREYESFRIDNVICDVSAVEAYIQSVRDKYSIEIFKITAFCTGIDLNGFTFLRPYNDCRFQILRHSASTGFRVNTYYSGSSLTVIVSDKFDKILFHHELDGLETTFTSKLLNHLSKDEEELCL